MKKPGAMESDKPGPNYPSAAHRLPMVATWENSFNLSSSFVKQEYNQWHSISHQRKALLI